MRALVALLALALGCTQKPTPPGDPVPAPAKSAEPASPSPAPAPALAERPEVPRPPPDPAFQAFEQETTKGCPLAGDPAGSTIDMSEYAWSLERCYWRRGRRFLARLPAARREILSAGARAGEEPWSRDWDQVARLTAEFTVLNEFASGAFFGGGTMIRVMLPAHRAGVALEALYALERGDTPEFAARVQARASAGAASRAAQSLWTARARRYVSLVPDVPSSGRPRSLQGLLGGEWRQIARDVDDLEKAVVGLAGALCDAALAARLGGESACREALQSYLYSQIGGEFPGPADAPPYPPDTEPLVPGVDPAYEGDAASAYDACPEDVRCLQKLGRRRLEGVVRDAGMRRDFLALERAVCDLEKSPAFDTTYRHGLAPDACAAVVELRAAFFLARWTTARRGELEAHRQFRAAWGARIASHIAPWQAHLTTREEAARKPSPDKPWAPKPRDLEAARASLTKLTSAAEALATRLCSTSELDADRSRCTRELREYWLSYSYVVGGTWQDEP